MVRKIVDDEMRTLISVSLRDSRKITQCMLCFNHSHEEVFITSAGNIKNNFPCFLCAYGEKAHPIFPFCLILFSVVLRKSGDS